jgi:hypothetical protein
VERCRRGKEAGQARPQAAGTRRRGGLTDAHRRRHARIAHLSRLEARALSTPAPHTKALRRIAEFDYSGQETPASIAQAALSAPAAPSVPATERQREVGWWALVMNAAADIEAAANCLRDPDAKQAADGAAKHYRKAAQAMLGEFTAAPQLGAHGAGGPNVRHHWWSTA